MSGIPPWVDAARLVGHDPKRPLWLDAHDAADVAERLRNVVLGGSPVRVVVEPGLPRSAVRDARLRAARRRRRRTAGFERSGVRLDAEGRVSLTPEAIALRLARRVRGASVVDACAGCGGNAIAFARAGCPVVAIEIDPGRLAMARHNARVYGVDSRIRFVRGDARDWVARLSADLLFVDPPWGGTNAIRRPPTLHDLPPLEDILAAARGRYERIWVKAPAAFVVGSLPGARVEPVFGLAPGDRDRVKFLLLELSDRS
ncbi:MAG: trimethylguanosine synthase [Myxococcota bacterium]|nr:trimethylguanosine synthase [Myxococcota bacterium]